MPWTDMGNYMAESIFKVTFPKPSPSFFPFPPSSPISNIPLKMNKTDNLYFWNLCHKYKYQLDSDASKFNNRMGLWDLFSRDKILKQLMSCQKKLINLILLFTPPDDSVESSSSTAPSINFTPSSPDIDSNDSLVNVNLDDPDSNDSNGWKVIDMIFSQSMYLVGPALIVNSIFQGLFVKVVKSN
ncbi:5218_t:CDS:2 [Cetraspora pellucida]|uniref:5218_t:CDS:1 n=1 Tax=Cetraspora pellucida TaxID=1433469 RepID=A0ACA9L9U2_9GLOM|nr:5218_t:CDS:2 [Cetraspora pellucida]